MGGSGAVVEGEGVGLHYAVVFVQGDLCGRLCEVDVSKNIPGEAE